MNFVCMHLSSKYEKYDHIYSIHSLKYKPQGFHYIIQKIIFSTSWLLWEHFKPLDETLLNKMGV